MSEKRAKNPLRTWYWNNLKTIVSYLRYRIFFLILDMVLVIFLFYALRLSLEYSSASGLVNQLFVLGGFAGLLFLPFLYGYRSLLQIIFETGLNDSLYDARKEIETQRIYYAWKRKETQIKLRGEKNFRTPPVKINNRALQGKINNLRIGLKAFIDYSEILAPPIYNYELDRLQKGIDIFFNSISEVLFPASHVFSRAEKIEQQQSLDYYESVEHPTAEELEEEYEAMQKAEMGVIYWFGLDALDEFLQYFADTLFAHVGAFSPLSFRHPIDLITLSRFFDHWNSIVSSCRNCKSAYKKSKKDIEDYYKLLGRRESQSRQRRHRLIDDVVVVIVSVVLSTIISSLIKG